MPRVTKNCLYLLILLFPVIVFGQTNGRQPVPPNSLREADVQFSKRVWRVIDLREKQNRRAVWPGAPINKILYDAVLNGKLIPYISDSLKSFYTWKQFKSIGSDTEYVQVPVDPSDPSFTRQDTLISAFDSQERIYELLLMEDWFFDRKLSSMSVRIIAIAPLYHVKALGVELGLQPLCWLKYHDNKNIEPDVRDLLIGIKMFNKENSRSIFTFDDWFEQRRFAGFIVKTSNMEDVSILQDPEVRKKGLEALIEAERLKQENYEYDANQYED